MAGETLEKNEKQKKIEQERGKKKDFR